MEERGDTTSYEKVVDSALADDRLSSADSVFLNDVVADDVIADDDESPASSRGGRCGCCGGCWSVLCVWIIVGCLYFFIIIPAGVLLIIHGYSRSFAVTLALGILLLFIVTCAIPGAYIALRYRRTTKKLNLSALRAKHARLVESDQHRKLSKVEEHLQAVVSVKN